MLPEPDHRCRPPVRRFTDREGHQFSVVTLSKQLALEHSDFLVHVHNFIPFQLWAVTDLLADKDERRTFCGKWELSTLALDSHEKPMGLCIGFELPADLTHYPHPGIYMHRMSLAPEWRGRYVGAILHAETLWRAFQRGIRILEAPPGPTVIYGQTNADSQNEGILRFHRDAGFSMIGRKRYPDRADIVMMMTLQQFVSSRHARLWCSRAVDRQGLPDLDPTISSAP